MSKLHGGLQVVLCFTLQPAWWTLLLLQYYWLPWFLEQFNCQVTNSFVFVALSSFIHGEQKVRLAWPGTLPAKTLGYLSCRHKVTCFWRLPTSKPVSKTDPQVHHWVWWFSKYRYFTEQTFTYYIQYVCLDSRRFALNLKPRLEGSMLSSPVFWSTSHVTGSLLCPYSSFGRKYHNRAMDLCNSACHGTLARVSC